VPSRPGTPRSRTSSRRPVNQRPSRRPRRAPRTRRQRVGLGALIALTVVTAVVAGAAAWGYLQFRRIERVDVDLERAAPAKPANFLVVGSDTRELGASDSGEAGIYGKGKEIPPSGQRADTIVIARVDPGRSTIEMLSVPRDLWVKLPAGNSQRINSAYNKGPQALVDTIESNLGITINHYVEVNFDGFRGLVEAVGGVPLYFDTPIRDRNSGLWITELGCQTLDPNQALAFARARHLQYRVDGRWKSDPTGDLGRITRQQVFLRHAFDQVSALGLGDLGSVRKLVGVAVDNVRIDEGLTTDGIIELARRFSKFDSKNMVVHRLQTEGFTTSGGADVLRLLPDDASPILDIFRGVTPATKAAPTTSVALTPDLVAVDVMNAAGEKGLAGAVAEQLRSGGFEVRRTDNTKTPTERNVVRYGAGAKLHAALLASRLDPQPDVVADDSIAGGVVELDVIDRFASVDAAPPTSTTSTTHAADASGSSSTVPQVIDGVPTNEDVVGRSIGDPPPGISCRT